MPFGGRPNHVPRTAQTTFPGRPQTDSGIRATCQVALIRRAQPRPPGGLEPPRAALRAAQLCLSSRSRRRGEGCSARAAPCAPREGGRNHGNAGFACFFHHLHAFWRTRRKSDARPRSATTQAGRVGTDSRWFGWGQRRGCVREAGWGIAGGSRPGAAPTKIAELGPLAKWP